MPDNALVLFICLLGSSFALTSYPLTPENELSKFTTIRAGPQTHSRQHLRFLPTSGPRDTSRLLSNRPRRSRFAYTYLPLEFGALGKSRRYSLLYSPFPHTSMSGPATVSNAARVAEYSTDLRFYFTNLCHITMMVIRN